MSGATRPGGARATTATAPPKTVLTEIGAVDLDVPRDRNGTFDPQLVPKHAGRLEGFNEKIVALYARGLSTRDIRRELARMYGVEVSPELISRSPTGWSTSSTSGSTGRWTRCIRSCTSTPWW